MRASALAVVLSLGLSGCANGAPARLGSAPAFKLRDVAGGTFDSKSLAGKVVVLDFWATWCGPCLAEIPEYGEFWKKNRTRGVEVIGVAVDFEDPQEISDFVSEQRIAYRQLLGDERVRRAFAVNEGLPTTFVIDQQGKLATRILGSSPDKFEELQKTVDALLAAGK